MGSELSPSITARQQLRGRLRRIAQWIGLALVAIVCVLLFAWNAFTPDVPQSALTLARGADGKFTTNVNNAKTGDSLQVQAGQIKSKNNSISSSGEASSGRARLACRHVLVQNKTDHLLAKRVAGNFLDELKQISFVGKIDYLPAGEDPPPGELAPDLFITLAIVDLQESGLIDHAVEAKVIVTMGSAPAADNHSVVGSLTPPLVQFRWNCQLEHQSTTREVASSAAKYKLVASDIATQIGKLVNKELNELRDKHGLLPELPSEFYPAYRAPPELPLEGLQAQITFTGHGLLAANETVWKCTTDKPLSEALAELRGRLVAAGWKGDADPDETRLSLKGLRGQLTAFGENAGGFGVASPKRDESGASAKAGEKRAEPTFFVRYEELATDRTRIAAVQKLFESGAPLSTLLIFENTWTVAQCKTLLDSFAEHPPTSGDTWLVIANIHHRDKDDEAAMIALRRAIALARVAPEGAADIKSRLSQLAKELGDEKLVEKLDKEPPDFDLVKELGYVEVSAAAELPAVEFGLDDTAGYFVRGDGDKWQVIGFSAKSTGGGASQAYQLGVTQVAPHSHSFSSGQSLSDRYPVHSGVSVEGLGHMQFEVIQQFGLPRFTVKAKIQPAPAGSSQSPKVQADGVSPAR